MKNYYNILEINESDLFEIASKSGFIEESSHYGSYSHPWNKQKSKQKRQKNRVNKYLFRSKRNNTHKDENDDCNLNQLKFNPIEEISEKWESMDGIGAI